MDTQTLTQLAPIFGAIGLAIALAILFFLKRMPVASQDMAELGEKIHRGAMVFSAQRIQSAADLCGRSCRAAIHVCKPFDRSGFCHWSGGIYGGGVCRYDGGNKR